MSTAGKNISEMLGPIHGCMRKVASVATTTLTTATVYVDSLMLWILVLDR